LPSFYRLIKVETQLIINSQDDGVTNLNLATIRRLLPRNHFDKSGFANAVGTG
jgi:hypothetical protein